MKKTPVAIVVLLLFSLSSFVAAQHKKGPFTHEKRSVRSRKIDQQHIRLEMTLDWDRLQLDGRASLSLKPFQPIRKVVLDAAEMKIKSVSIGTVGHDEASLEKDRELKFHTHENQLEVTLDREYQPRETFRLVIDYQVTEPNRGMYFIVPDQREPGQLKMAWTQSEPEDARYWFPCIDSPADRFTSEIIATVPKDYFVLSNGVLKSKKENDNDTRTWHWVQEQSHVSYLMSVVAGEFVAYEQNWDGIPIISYVPPHRLDDAPRSFKKTPAMMKLFSEKLDFRYPWPKYAQICVDEYVAGGMEHTSATTLTLKTLHDERAHLDVSSDGLVAHELAHQWFGDLMTCKDWGELWLNESFATYFATIWTEHDRGIDEATWARYREGQSYLGEDSGRYRRSIVNYSYDKPSNMFDRHSYPKGGRVLHMLRYVLGEKLFWRSLSHYCKVHQYDTVETSDLRVAIEQVTGQGLGWFFDQWVYHGGHPEYEVSYQWDDEQNTVLLTVKQNQQVDSMTPLFRMPIEIELVTPDATITRRISVSKKEETFHLNLDERPIRVTFDPRDWILKTLSFSKSKEELLGQLAEDHHMICRVRAAQSLAKLKKNQEIRAALAKAVRSDNFWAVRQEAVKALAGFNGEVARDALLEAAGGDAKSRVRVEAIKGLANFSHEQTKKRLRQIIKDDRSYFAIAEAVRSLAKVDRKGCREDLLAALEIPSHNEMVMRAASDALADLKLEDTDATERLLARLQDPAPADRRRAVMNALAKLGGGDKNIIAALERQLNDDRYTVRRTAAEALGKTGNPDAIDLLLERRKKEQRLRMLTTIDDAVKKLRADSKQLDPLRKELKDLREKQRKLEERIDRFEDAVENKG